MTHLSPFQQLLGTAFDHLPPMVHRFHSLDHPLQSQGQADIRTSPGLLRWLICKFAGLPKAGHQVPVQVRFTPQAEHGEFWQRHFSQRAYASRMQAGTGAHDHLLIEHFGLFKLYFALTVQEDGLAWSLAKWRFLNLPLPTWSTPRIDCLETDQQDCFHFDIDVHFPVVGHVIHYQGFLAPVPGTDKEL